MTHPQRIAAVGVDPATVDPIQLGKLFGRNSDHKMATDLQRANPRKYAELREVAKILGTY
jgi:hypothetical protein